MTDTNGKKYVTWYVFTWVVSIVTTLLLALFAYTSAIAGDTQINKTDIAVQQEQYRNIEKTLLEIKELLKK